MKKIALIKTEFKRLMKFSFTQLCITMIFMGISFTKNADAQDMYLPRVWLKKETNKVVVLDYIDPVSTLLQGLTKPESSKF